MNKIILISLLFLSSSIFAQKEDINPTIDTETIKPLDKTLELKESSVRLITPDMIIEVKNNSKANELVNKIIEVKIIKEELLRKSYILKNEIAMLELQHKKDKLEDDLNLYQETRESRVKLNIENEKNEISKLFKILEKLKQEMSVAEKLTTANKIFNNVEIISTTEDGLSLKTDSENKSE